MKLLGPPLISILTLLLFTYFMVRYWMLLSQQPWRYRYLLFSLRTCTLLCFVFLLLNPRMNWIKNELNRQNISVIFDLSESMFKHLEDIPLQYDEIYTKIKSWGENNDLSLKYFQLGRKIIKLDNIESTNLTTDFRAIPDFISFEHPKQILLITDGKATAGKNINEIEFSQLYPIHTLGVGPVQIDQDIEIQDVFLPDLLSLGDTVNLKIRIQARLHESLQSDFEIINVEEKKIYYERILFEKGNRLKYLSISIPSHSLNGLNVATIYPVSGEIQIENNTLLFSGNLQDAEDDILLITGALSQNSRIIKSLLDDINNTNIHHIFRMDMARWNAVPLNQKYFNLKMIVLDDFPLNNGDSQLFQKIVALSKSKQLPILYMQGPKSNLTAGEMIRSTYPNFIPKAEDSKLLMNISTQSSWLETSDLDLDKLPPQNRSVKWILNEKPWLSYRDESVLIANKNSFYLISLPALAESHFKISKNSNLIVPQLLQKVFLHAFHGNTGFLKLEVNGNSFNKGEMIQIKLFAVKGIDLKDFAVNAVHETDTLRLECSEESWDEEIQCSTTFLKSGKYNFYADAIFPNGEKVYSNTQSTIVQDVEVELNELIQERQALMEISHKTGGAYASIDSLDAMLAHIDITPVQRVKYHQISGLESQNYWWILILLLSVEWYFRKKLGLL